jgi:subtilisin-like proprotein convertase family protein
MRAVRDTVCGMKCFALLLAASSIGLFACATDNNTSPDGGSAPVGGEGGTPPTGGSPDGGAGGKGTGCAQDCSEIEVPNCYVASCNTETGVCEIDAAEDGSDCEDGLFCTTGDTCNAGVCQAGGPLDCAEGDDDPCLVAACDEADDSCSTATAPNGTACITTDICSSNAICQNGICQGAPLDCSATPLNSPDCEVAECDPSSGLCVVVPTNDGLSCIYGDICESDKTCNAGVCEGTPIAECTSCTETEVNNDFLTANSGVGCAAWAGALTTFGDVDCFEIEVTVPGSRVTATVTDVGGAGCPPGFNPEITLFDSAGNFLASDFFSAGNGCPTFLPDNTGATDLPVGTYSVCVDDPFGGGTSPPYLLLLSALPPGCGNVIVEGTEECDGTNLGFEDCITQGFGSGTLTCDASCAFDTSACAAPFCGDTFANGTEDCDGVDLAGATCVSEGFAGGSLSCTPGCAFNTSACVMPGCGNGLLELGEDCDGSPAACSACAFTCGAGQVPFSVNGVSPVAIPEFGVVTSTAAVPTTGTIASLAVQINLTHTFDGDLAISVTSPLGTNVPLSTNNGSFNQDYTNTVFSTLGTTNIVAGSAPFQGVFTPNGNLASFNGQSPAGTWTLVVDDVAFGDFGTINGWRVFGCVNP